MEFLLWLIVIFMVAVSIKQSSRITALEKILKSGTAPKPQPAGVPVMSAVAQSVSASVQPTAQPVTVASAVKPASKSKGFSEAQIGKEWFNKIGAVSIIIGVVLFISYSFQYLGPTGKIVIGYLGGAFLIGAGLFFSQKYRKYANALLAVGWAILYFTTFATHYIQASRIIDNPNVTVTLLFAVSAALALFSYFYKSEEFSIYAISLGALSAVISPISLVSLIAIVALMMASAVMAIARNWATLGFFSVIASYLTYLLAFARQGGLNSDAQFQLGTTFLVIYFILFATVSFFLKSGKYQEKHYGSAMITTNAIGFFILFIGQLYDYYPKADGWCTGVFALLLFILAGLAYAIDQAKSHRFVTYAWLGWGFATLAIPLQLTGTWIAGAWLAEGAVLFIIGLLRNKPRFQFTGAVTLALFGLHFILFDLAKRDTFTLLQWEIKERVIFTLFTALVFLVITGVWDKARIKLSASLNNAIVAAPGVALGCLILITYLDGNRDVASLIFLFMATTAYGVGLATDRLYLRAVSLLPFACVLMQWAGYDLTHTRLVYPDVMGQFNFRILNSLVLATVLYILYAVSVDYEKFLNENEKNFRDAFAIVAACVVVILTWLEVNPRLITMFWSIEGVFILLAGLLVAKRVLRLSGIVIMLIAILRIFIIDLSFLETIYRIVSFIVLGVILMGISFLYTKYKDKIL